MKKRDLVLVAVILIASAALWAVSRLLFPAEGCILRITVNGELYGEYSMEEDQVITIGDTNVCRIEDGSVTMTEALCPDHLCMRTAPITKKGGTIVCLPNRVFLEVVALSDEEVPDAVAS